MRRARALSVVVVVVVAVGIASSAGIARAQGAPDPNAYTVPEETPTGYPTEIVDRPLLYPQGVEAGVLLGTPTNDVVDLFDFMMLDVGGRLGTGKLELFGSVSLWAKQAEGVELDSLQSITGGGAFEVGPNQAVRGALSIGTPTSDELKTIDAAGTYELKRKLAPKLAVEAAAGLRFLNFLPDPAAPDPIWLLSATARAQAQVQLAPTLCVFGTAQASIPFANSPEELQTQNVFDLSATGLVTLAPKLDVFGSILISDAFDDDDRLTWFTVGAWVRL